MKRILLLIVLLCGGFFGHSQMVTTDLDGIKNDSVVLKPDPLYREDQIYAGISYNLIQAKPTGYSQYAVPVNLVVGVLRDIPLNKKRNHAIAIGLGYSYTNIKHTLVVQDIEGKRVYENISSAEYDKNKLVLHYAELPIEFRWRNSNDTSHQFWRVYGGFKLSYLLHGKAQYDPDSNTQLKISNDPNMNKVMTGVYVAGGYNTWNFYVYYGLNTIYKGVTMVSGEQLNLRPIHFGLMFYIL